MRALIDCFTGRLYLIGPGGYQIKVSPGSETHELVESHAGHLMLPCSDFQDNSKATTETMQVMTVSDASPATANRVTVVDPWRDWDGDGSNSDGAATIDGDSDGAATVVNDFVPAAMTSTSYFAISQWENGNAQVTEDGSAPPVSTNAGGVPEPRS